MVYLEMKVNYFLLSKYFTKLKFLDALFCVAFSATLFFTSSLYLCVIFFISFYLFSIFFGTYS